MSFFIDKIKKGESLFGNVKVLKERLFLSIWLNYNLERFYILK